MSAPIPNSDKYRFSESPYLFEDTEGLPSHLSRMNTFLKTSESDVEVKLPRFRFKNSYNSISCNYIEYSTEHYITTVDEISYETIGWIFHAPELLGGTVDEIRWTPETTDAVDRTTWNINAEYSMDTETSRLIEFTTPLFDNTISISYNTAYNEYQIEYPFSIPNKKSENKFVAILHALNYVYRYTPNNFDRFVFLREQAEEKFGNLQSYLANDPPSDNVYAFDTVLDNIDYYARDLQREELRDRLQEGIANNEAPEEYASQKVNAKLLADEI